MRKFAVAVALAAGFAGAQAQTFPARPINLIVPFPPGGSTDTAARINSAMVQALADPAVKARFSDLGLDVASREQQTPEGLAAFHKAEIEKWWPIIKAANIKIE